jgi:hypothetical protein
MIYEVGVIMIVVHRGGPGHDLPLFCPLFRDDRRPHRFQRRINPRGMQHREEPPFRVSFYRRLPCVGADSVRVPD